MKKLFFLLPAALLLQHSLKAQCWSSVSVGYQHAIAIGGDGTLWSWGMNHRGELGDGTNGNFETLPQLISSDTDWQVVEAGNGPYTFNLALKTDGTLWAWGDNIYGQLGDGTKTMRLVPVQVGTSLWKSISAGYTHSLGIKTDGTLWAWGDNDDYALGLGAGNPQAGDYLTPMQVGTLDTWKQVAAGDSYSIALKTDGTVFGWGSNTGGPLDIASAGTEVSTPTQRSGIYSNDIKSVSAGKAVSYDVKNNGLAIHHGYDSYGAAGGTNCSGCPQYFVKASDGGQSIWAIIKTDGTLWFAGKKFGYQENTVQYTNQFLQLGTDNDWSSVSVGNQSGAAIKNDGSMYTWGWNFYGVLGVGTSGSGGNENADSETLLGVTCPAALATVNVQHETKLAAYPNPASAVFYLSGASGSSHVILVDVLGKTVLESHAVANGIDISHLAKGIYFVNVYEADTVRCIRLVKS